MNKIFLKFIVIFMLISTVSAAIYLNISNKTNIQKAVTHTNDTPINNSKSLKTHEVSYTSKLLFMGDTMLARTIGSSILNNLNPYVHVLSVLDKYDARIANIETTIADPSVSFQVIGKKFTFNAPISGVSTLTKASITVAGLANNHTRDYGAAATENMIDMLRAAGIQTVGAGRNTNEAFAPTVIEVPAPPLSGSDQPHSIRVAVIAVNDIENNYTNVTNKSAGSAFFDKDRIKSAIKTAKTAWEADIVVVFPHWGVEYQAQPTERQKEWGHFFIDNGADIVIGSHPHVTQPTETYKGKYIVYSLGNFIFDQMTGDAARGQMIALVVTKTGAVTDTGAFDPYSAHIKLGVPQSLPTVLDPLGFPTLQ